MKKPVFYDDLVNDISNLKKKTTPNYRALSKKYYAGVRNQSLDEILEISTYLLETGKWVEKLIAFEFAFQKRKEYTIQTFDIFEQWVKKYLKDWSDCDDFTTHALGYLIHMYPELSFRLKNWVTDSNFAVRRAAATSLLIAIKKRNQKIINPFSISNLLMYDSHYLVQKGFGWMLKVYAQYELDLVVTYLKDKHHEMTRLAFRYAIEKMPIEVKRYLMSL
ncbi:MAG: DNA alkylation repair protein [Firmicutes bacterium]|nr:DNA alkylation repair protein [Bacillota bacterium]